MTLLLRQGASFRDWLASRSSSLHRILLLEDLGFSLEQIRELLSADAKALAALRQRDDDDPKRIVIFGGSIGGTYAPLRGLAAHRRHQR